MSNPSHICSRCRRCITVKPDAVGQQYGYDEHDRKICYACCADIDRERMMRGGRITLYLTMYNDVEWAAARVMSSYQLSYSQRFKITNFPGSLVIMPFSVRPGTCHGFGGKYPIYLVYFIGPDGYEWYGRCAEHNQILRCQRVKKQSLSMAGIVWTTQDGRQLPIGSMEPAHLDNTIRKINREVAAGSKWGRLHLKYVAPMQKILDAKRARGDPERYRDGAESYSLSNEDPDYGD